MKFSTLKSLFCALALATVVLTGGCKTLESDTQKIAATCATATSSIRIADLYRDKLTETQITRVKQAIKVIEPVCGDRDTLPTLDSVKQAAFDAAVSELFQIASEAKR